MDEDTLKTLKQMKEEFVSNLSGGSITEINSVTLVALVCTSLEMELTWCSRLMLSGRRYKHEPGPQIVEFMVCRHFFSIQH